jgi:phosphoglycolate phosphatase
VVACFHALESGVKPHTLLFDLDGTLTDPKLGITRCMRYAFERLSVICPADEVLASSIGPPLRGTFATLLRTSDAAQIEQALGLYRQRFSTLGLYENEIYTDVPAMLDAVRGSGVAAFVATSKPKVYATRILEHFGLLNFFKGIYGPELDDRYDKAALLAQLLVQERVSAEGAVMIGDRGVDVLAAKANRVGSVGVMWGYGSEAELAEAGADLLCRHPDELLLTLAQLAT